MRSAEVEPSASSGAARLKYARNASTAASILFDKKWKVHIFPAMRAGPVRLGQLGRLIPGASKKVLTQHLRQLESDGLVVRTDLSDVVLHVKYTLAERPEAELLALLDHLAEWGRLYLTDWHPSDGDGL